MPSTTMSVTRKYTYGQSGRTSSVTTCAGSHPCASSDPTFTATYAYDVLGNVKELGYPECVAPAVCSASDPARVVKSTYSNGYLTSLYESQPVCNFTGCGTSYITNATYHASGMKRLTEFAAGAVSGHEKVTP